MGQRGSLLMGMMAVGVIITFAFIIVVYSLPRYSTSLNPAETDTAAGGADTNSGSVGGTPAEILEQANSVKIQADLKSIQTSMLAYYAEQGTYPSSLEELVSYMGVQVDSTNIKYLSCSDNSVALYHNSSGYPGYVFNYEEVTTSKGSPPPSCGT